MSPHRFTSSSNASRTPLIWAGVALAHGAALWALQGALSHPKPIEIIVPAVLLSEFIAPPAPPARPAAPTPPTPPQPPPPPPPVPSPPKPAPVPKPRVVRKAAPAPAPLPVAAATPEAIAVPAPPTQPTQVAPQPVVVAPPAPPAPPARPAPPAPPKIEQPSSNAAYLHNPSPAYPAISKRMGEQGKVRLRVLVNTEGQPQQIEVQQSSGYERLDWKARETVQRWRFVPGKRDGVTEAMWVVVPINFVLE